MATQTLNSSDLNAHTLDVEAVAASTDRKGISDLEKKTDHYNDWPNDDGVGTYVSMNSKRLSLLYSHKF